jgi:uncharacterized protein YecT (DUF1311 family)
MWKYSFLLVSLLVFAIPANAAGIDCTKATTALEKFICADPKLKKVDDELSATYSRLVWKVKDKTFHEALVKSQRRWLRLREEEGTRILSETAANRDRPLDDPRVFVFETARDRLADFKNKTLMRNLSDQLKLMGHDRGGEFQGFNSDCFFTPQSMGGPSYQCLGSWHRQNGSRVCSGDSYFATSRDYQVGFVSEVVDGKLVPMASCKVKFEPRSCPLDGGPPDGNEKPSWFIAKLMTADTLESPVPVELWKYDPDVPADSFTDGYEWINTCLNTKDYPPAEQFRTGK